MKRFTVLLPLFALLLAASCKETDPFLMDMVELEEAKPVYLPDSVSFMVQGKRFTSESKLQSYNRSFGNQGVNLRLSDTSAEWYHTNFNGKYWIGAPDSVQYFSAHKIYLKNGQFELSFIANRRKAEMLYLGTMYFPRDNEIFYHVGDYGYAVDFNRFGCQEGVAIRLGIEDVGLGATFSDKTMSQSSILTSDSQKDSKFKITKITEMSGTDDVRIEGVFEMNLFDGHEKKLVRVTEGYFRSTLFKAGNGYHEMKGVK